MGRFGFYSGEDGKVEVVKLAGLGSGSIGEVDLIGIRWEALYF